METSSLFAFVFKQLRQQITAFGGQQSSIHRYVMINFGIGEKFPRRYLQLLLWAPWLRRLPARHGHE